MSKYSQVFLFLVYFTLVFSEDDQQIIYYPKGSSSHDHYQHHSASRHHETHNTFHDKIEDSRYEEYPPSASRLKPYPDAADGLDFKHHSYGDITERQEWPYSHRSLPVQEDGPRPKGYETARIRHSRPFMHSDYEDKKYYNAPASEQRYDGDRSPYGSPVPRDIGQFRDYPSRSRVHNPSYHLPQEFEYHPEAYDVNSNIYTDEMWSQLVDSVKPYPFYQSVKRQEHYIPDLGRQSHCFLQGAPFTECGRKTLESVLLKQCMDFYIQMINNVEGLCHAKHARQPRRYRKYSSLLEESSAENTEKSEKSEKSSKQSISADEKSSIYKDPNLGEMRTNGYLREKCYQQAYISITTAMVLCLTENMIRSEYIRHYRIEAETNPIEGSVIYLRKLHYFIEEVLHCSGKDKIDQFPNLWHIHKNGGHVSYNPHSPFVVSPDFKVHLDSYMSSKASGMSDIRVGDLFLCADTADIEIDGSDATGVYKEVYQEPHYSLEVIQKCTSPMKKLAGNTVLKGTEFSKVLRQCNLYSGEKDPDKKKQFLSTSSLRGFYDSTRFNSRADLTRPQTIGEIATHDSGILSQPILEGHGIMYFCAFYACKANYHGNTHKTCFPEFHPDHDWNIPNLNCNKDHMDNLGRYVSSCLSKNILTSHDLELDEATRLYEKSLERSYTCIAEPEIARFIKFLYPNVGTKDNGLSLLYVRHLAVESCYDHENGKCAPTSELYNLLKRSLESLVKKCKAKQDYLHKKYGYEYNQRKNYESAHNDYHQHHNRYDPFEPVFHPYNPH